ncbi:cytochrome c oxidase accessory protein CcoG [Dyadobacter chenwenxiniae]|uniref:Cytochrome c oxidase accessory protein CcoG n=1 Tax=Dyadobacter chenwenxiniae TaxID=2906456 RepID=A0A9X1TE51_9BACT|nr:cytochrome c oxidase accessory protein CcoG [Dyadobacter chenwenxiniae]MCF0062606.1 cytochrome c oxidase accessory protein CcoG [Dyadobacter chenwenxiniae]UON83647.1 cytochrome c oxidase accessory protein CcoG [Dyadobacter chenwenxiniae]
MKIPNQLISDSDESFRDHFSAVTEDGKRNWFYPQKPTGKWHTRRVWFTVAILTLLFVTPFITFNDQPLLLFNVLERKFIIFGIFIGPQDYWLFGLTMLSFMVFIVLFTTIFGRLWCGWACPQTVFMEMVFRKIEYAIEGNATKQKLLNKAPWNTEKIVRKTAKYAAFLIVSFLIANLLLAYVLGVDELSKIIREPISEHIPLFSGIIAFTAIFYFNFAWLRDQACTVVCPYGRLQGVLMDRNTINVAYDYERGEPRGKIHKNQERTEGDCINCHQCVAVCPTGIDIRNGLQMECVNCTACIDACDNIMDKVGFEKGLIRYTSENAIVKKTNKLITTRVVGAMVMLVLLWSVLGFMVVSRTDTQTMLLRAPGSQYIENSDRSITNLYTFKIFNKTNQTINPTIRLEGVSGKLIFAGKPNLALDPAGMVEGTVFIVVPAEALKKRKTTLTLSVFQGNEKLEEFETTFIAPEK